MPVRSWVQTLQNSNGVLVFKMNDSTYLNLIANENDIMIPAFFSESSNTFTFEGENSDGVAVSKSFIKNGNIHTLNEDLLAEFHRLVIGSFYNNKVPLTIKFNGVPIQQYSLTE